VKNEFAWFRDHYAENMERMFAAVSDLYAEYWHDFFHFAIFEDDAESWDVAFERTHRRYADALRLEQAAHVLELACGRGGFADFMAANTSGNVLGIDISRSQLSHAARHKRPNLRFRHHDIMRVDELAERFDAVVFMDADCYLPDKQAAVARIARVMNPGARFLLVAWCKREGLSSLQEELVLDPFKRYWGVPGLETPSAYRDHFRRAGLRLIEEIDLNDKVRRNWDFGYERAIDGIREVSIAKAAKLVWKGLPLGPDGIRLLKDQFHAALYIKAGFDAGFLRYTYFLTEKT
jgi:cyclopropane-fatty-acyl-phospholipid synthase